MILQLRSKHPQDEHVEEKVQRPAMYEHIAEELPYPSATPYEVRYETEIVDEKTTGDKAEEKCGEIDDDQVLHHIRPARNLIIVGHSLMVAKGGRKCKGCLLIEPPYIDHRSMVDYSFFRTDSDRYLWCEEIRERMDHGVAVLENVERVTRPK